MQAFQKNFQRSNKTNDYINPLMAYTFSLILNRFMYTLAIHLENDITTGTVLNLHQICKHCLIIGSFLFFVNIKN